MISSQGIKHAVSKILGDRPSSMYKLKLRMSASNITSQILKTNTLLNRSENGGKGWRETEYRSLCEVVMWSHELPVIVVIFLSTPKE